MIARVVVVVGEVVVVEVEPVVIEKRHKKPKNKNQIPHSPVPAQS